MADQDDQIIKFIGFAQLGELSEMRALMRRYNLDVNVSYDVSGTTALLAAISFNQVSCVEWLINNGADVNLGDKEGRTPLHYAAKVSKPLAYKLIQQDANVNARARNGMTPLHCAFQSQQLDIVVLLLNSGADIATRDNEKRLPTDLATELFVNEVHRRTRRRYMTADEMSPQASEEEVHESAHVAEDIEEPVVTRVKPRSSPRKQHAPEDDVSAQEEIELLRSALRDAQRALEQSNSKQMQQAITLYKQAALTRKAEVESMAVRMRELEAELHARDVEIRELKRRIEDMRANQRMSRGNTPAKRRRSTSQSPRPNKRRRVSGRQQSREEEEEEEDEEEDEAGEVAEQVEDKNAASEDNPSEDEAGEKRQTPNVRTRSASKQTSSAKKSPRENKSPTQSRSTPKSAKQQPKSAKQQPKQASSASSEEESAGESQSSSTSSSESAKASKKASDKSKEKNAKNRKSDASKTVEVSIVGERNRAGDTEWRVSSSGGTKTWMSIAEMKKKYDAKAVQEAIERYRNLHGGKNKK